MRKRRRRVSSIAVAMGMSEEVERGCVDEDCCVYLPESGLHCG